MIYLTIDDDFRSEVPSARMEKVVETAMDYLQIPRAVDLSVVFSGDDEIQALNRQYLDNDAPTDVLSFPADEIDPETGDRYLGDIILSVPQARRQAEAGGHPLAAELELLVVHGVLHLSGHDHAEEEEKARMWEAQREILTQCHNPLAAQF